MHLVGDCTVQKALRGEASRNCVETSGLFQKGDVTLEVPCKLALGLIRFRVQGLWGFGPWVHVQLWLLRVY